MLSNSNVFSCFFEEKSKVSGLFLLSHLLISKNPPRNPLQRVCCHRVLTPPPLQAKRRQVEIIWTSKIFPSSLTGIGDPYSQNISCVDMNSPYKQMCWTKSVVPLDNSLLWACCDIQNAAYGSENCAESRLWFWKLSQKPPMTCTLEKVDHWKNESLNRNSDEAFRYFFESVK